MVFFYDLHAALTLTSVPTAVFILLHLTVCLQLCIFYVSTVHAAVCIHPTCGRLFKDFLFVPLCLHLKCKKNNGSAFLGVCDWAGNCYTPVHCGRSGTSAGPELSVLEIQSLPPPRWMCHGGVMASKHPFFFFFFTFSIAFPKRWRWKDGLLQLNSRGGTWTVACAADLSSVLVIPHRIAVIIILALMRPRRTLQFYNHYNLLNSTT